MTIARRRAQLGAIFLGGAIGPFTGQALAVVLPQVADDFSIPLNLAASTISFYLFPFALTMLVSGRLTSGFAPRPFILTAYAITVALGLTLLVVPVWWLFALVYASMGVANAFTTPLLQSLLRSVTPPEHLGQALGTYAAMQSLGMLSAPLISGLVAPVNWRLTFLFTVVGSACVLAAGVPSAPPSREGDAPSTGRVRLAPVILNVVTSFVVGFGVVGLGFLTALHVGDAFGLGSAARGLVVMCGGATAFVASRFIGRAADTYGVRTVLVASSVLAAVGLALVPLAPAAALVAVAWAVAVASAQGMQATVNLAVLQGPSGSALISTVQAFRFIGVALAPLVFLPIYQAVGTGAYAAAVVALAAVAVAQVAARPKRAD